MTKYTDEEIDYVIKELDFEFMKNILKSSPDDLEIVMSSLAGVGALLRFRFGKLINEIMNSITRRKS